MYVVNLLIQCQINTMFCERMLVSRDRETVKAEIQTFAPKTWTPREIIRAYFEGR